MKASAKVGAFFVYNRFEYRDVSSEKLYYRRKGFYNCETGLGGLVNL